MCLWAWELIARCSDRVSLSVMEVSVVSDEPGVLHQVWGRQAISCLEEDLVQQVGDILQGMNLPFLHGELQCQPVCLQCGLSPCLSALKCL